MAVFNLPDEPVDRYRIEWWSTEFGEYVNRCHAVYYVDADYREVCPGDGSGARIVDQWMVYRDGNREGRAEGWLTPRSWEGPDIHPDRRSAERSRLAKLEGRLRSLEEEAEEVREKIESARLMMTTESEGE